jgi:hypothetical protein
MDSPIPIPSFILSCIECFEKSVHSLGVQTHSRILHGQSHTIPLFPFGCDHHVSRTIIDGAHGI